MKAILFDYFGVLSTPIYTPIVRKYFPEAEWSQWFKKFELLDLGEMTEDEMNEQVGERARIPVQQIASEVAEMLQANDALFAFIQNELKGKYKLGILSNILRSMLERIAGDKINLFDVAIISSDVKMIKPDPRIFEIAIAKLGVPAEEIVFIDDKAENIEAAKKLGMQGIVYTDFDSFKAALTKLVKFISSGNS